MNLQQYARGHRHTFNLGFSAGSEQIELPVILLRGANSGPTLVVTAGVHGDEYEGVRTIFEVTRAVDAVTMSGDLLCVPVCNPPAFWNVSRCSPLDGGNLARVFPGKPDGSPTEVIAWHIDQQVLPHAEFYLDLHSAGVRFLMPTMVGYDAGDRRSETAARAFGAPVLWGHDVIAPGRTISSAKARAIPWLYTEARGAGRVHPQDLEIYRRGVVNLLRHLGILPGTPDASPPRHMLFGDGNVDESLTTQRRGFLIPQVELLQTVKAGQALGSLCGLRGETLETYQAPRDGVVALIHACPVVHPGEPLFLITGARP